MAFEITRAKELRDEAAKYVAIAAGFEVKEPRSDREILIFQRGFNNWVTKADACIAQAEMLESLAAGETDPDAFLGVESDF